MSDRQKLVSAAVSYIGCKESDGSHKKIIDIYNAHKPLARGYAVKYTDAWCATFVSAMAIKCGLTAIIPTECGCEKMINLFEKLGSWQENDAYVPKPGDVIFYDWDDSGIGDNKGYTEHVGIVEKVTGTSISVIEGNFNNAVGRRSLNVNGRYIRGYGVPKYADSPKLETGNDIVWELMNGKHKIEITEVSKAVKAVDEAKKSKDFSSLYWILYKLVNGNK